MNDFSRKTKRFIAGIRIVFTQEKKFVVLSRKMIIAQTSNEIVIRGVINKKMGVKKSFNWNLFSLTIYRDRMWLGVVPVFRSQRLGLTQTSRVFIFLILKGYCVDIFTFILPLLNDKINLKHTCNKKLSFNQVLNSDVIFICPKNLLYFLKNYILTLGSQSVNVI